MPRLISIIAHLFSRSVSYVPRWYSSTRKNTYRSYYFTRRCSYVFFFFTRTSSARLKFTRELSRKDGTRNRYRSDTEYSRFHVTLGRELLFWAADIMSFARSSCELFVLRRCPYPLHATTLIFGQRFKEQQFWNHFFPQFKNISNFALLGFISILATMRK